MGSWSDRPGWRLSTRILGRAMLVCAFSGLLVEPASASSSVTRYPVPSVASLVWGSDGNLWFAESAAIGVMTPQGAVTSYPLPSGHQPGQLALGPDGNVWFTESNSLTVGQITSSGSITEFAAKGGLNASWTVGIAVGPDGNVWFTDNSPQIGKMTTAGVATAYQISAPARSIAAGPDGNLWFTEPTIGEIGRSTPSGQVSEFVIPGQNPQPEAIASGPAGHLWFTLNASSRLGQIDTSGIVSESSVPGQDVDLSSLVADTAGDLWFTDPNDLRVGEILPSGSVTEFAVPDPPQHVASSPDGKIWFGVPTADYVGMFDPTAIAVPQAIPAGSAPNEQQPSQGGGFVAWDQANPSSAKHWDVWARASSGAPFKVNPAGTQAYMGGIDGTTLVYQLIRCRSGRCTSQIAYYNLKKRKAMRAPASLNDPGSWEWEPRVWHGNVLFARQPYGSAHEYLDVFEPSSHGFHGVASGSYPTANLEPGGINGSYITWAVSNTAGSRVYVSSNYFGSNKTQVPNPDSTRPFEYGSSVGADGTVFLVRSSKGCGANVQLMATAGGDPRVIASLPTGQDIFNTSTTTGAGGVNTLVYADTTCKGPVSTVLSMDP